MALCYVVHLHLSEVMMGMNTEGAKSKGTLKVALPLAVKQGFLLALCGERR